ncbi:MAG: S9 family peptidase [Thermaerobacter sp.]|nr:S9 family peptidase [Thermaerobacter sp.]
MVKRRLVPEDLFRFIIPEEVAMSPDGQRLYYVESRMDGEHDTYRKRIMTVDRATGQTRALTQGPRDESPRISPDGRYLAFVSKRPPAADRADLYVLSFAGGDPVKLTNWAEDVFNPVWSPDSQSLVVEVMISGPGLPASAEDARHRRELGSPRERFTRDVRRISRLSYRMDTVGYYDGRFRHLVQVPLDPDRGGLRLTDGPYHHHSPCFSPDGRYLAFAANRRFDADLTPRDRIWVMERSTSAITAVTPEAGDFGTPVFAPDSRTLYGFGHFLEYGFYTQTRLYAVDVTRPEETFHQISDPKNWDFGNHALDDMHAHTDGLHPSVASDGGTLYVIASRGGTVQAAAVNLQDGHLTPMTRGEQVVYAMATDAECKTFGLLIMEAAHPGDLFWAERTQGAVLSSVTRATHLNRDLLDEVTVYHPERFSFQTDPAGDQLDGFLLYPDSPGRHPLAVEVHGGPMAMYAPVFFLEFQLLAAAGIGVVFANPHGSRGYGEAFCASIRGAWGQQDFQDVLQGLDAALRTNRFDPDRLAILGGSYGGFMTNWAIGHSDRFRAAVTMRSVVDELSFFGTSDIGYLDGWEWGAVPWQHPHRYLTASPLMAVENITTPLLILHSEEDYRCPVSQAEELFAALKYLGRETEFVRFPGESHELSRSGNPWHRVHRLELIRDWLSTHLSDGTR